MENIRAYYKKDNHLNPSAALIFSVTVSLILTSTQAEKLDITFEGNASVSSKALLKETPFLMLKTSGMTSWKRQSQGLHPYITLRAMLLRRLPR